MYLVPLLGGLLLLSSCSSRKYLSEGEYLLDKVSISADTADVNVSMLSGYVRQQPNTRWVSMIKLPLGIYLMSSPNGNSLFDRFARKMGEAPVVYDTLLSERSRQRIHDALFNMGYLHADVSTHEEYRKHKVRVRYDVHLGEKFYVDTIMVEVRDTSIAAEMDKIAEDTRLKKGMPFDANILNEERSRITNHMTENGFFAFNRDFIRYEVDTVRGSTLVRLKMIVSDSKMYFF